MKGVDVYYLDRWVPKKSFRTFVYSKEGSKKLVESWHEYENQLKTGLWFSTEYEEEANENESQDENLKSQENPKRKKHKSVADTINNEKK